ncbi:ARIF-1 [Alphabaculovirus myunipunctae]|uniref:ARIF-1 n=1 Tax=Mythimna unipuncta nucleopolyhedrovirus TaxID=447897 RepID=A0A2K9VS49_9ABAC|nr:ARIF-1 [Mythimna unipuncta nucleopolyhedrovirus]AUV65288.1 ARIF-1 [Mythimna unipuncta nucleopolyhedrovirus]
MTMALSCSAIKAIAVVSGATGACIAIASAVGVASSRYALLIDYENGSPLFNCSAFALMYGVVMMTIGAAVACNYHRTVRGYSVVGTLTTISIVVVLAFLCTMNWVVQFGHLPALDVLVRDYDNDAACWDGIVVRDYNEILPSGIIASNCFVEHELTFCVRCRNEYRRGEPTFIKTHRFELVFALFALLTFNLWSLWWLYHAEPSSIEVLSTSSITTDDDDEDDISFDENIYKTPRNNRPVSDALLLPPPPPSWIFTNV